MVLQRHGMLLKVVLFICGLSPEHCLLCTSPKWFFVSARLLSAGLTSPAVSLLGYFPLISSEFPKLTSCNALWLNLCKDYWKPQMCIRYCKVYMKQKRIVRGRLVFNYCFIDMIEYRVRFCNSGLWLQNVVMGKGSYLNCEGTTESACYSRDWVSDWGRVGSWFISSCCLLFGKNSLSLECANETRISPW